MAAVVAVEGCYFYRGNVIEVEEFTTEENRRELLLLEEEQGFSAELVLVVFVV